MIEFAIGLVIMGAIILACMGVGGMISLMFGESMSKLEMILLGFIWITIGSWLGFMAFIIGKIVWGLI